MKQQASASSAPSTSPQDRPFKGRITGTFVNRPTSTQPMYDGVANANGTVTHLGVFSKVTSDVINIFLRTIEGTFIMTATGGEQLMGKYNGTFSLEGAPGSLSWTLNATITGGTGRFSTATGKFVFLAIGKYVIADGIISGDYTETFAGTIHY